MSTLWNAMRNISTFKISAVGDVPPGKCLGSLIARDCANLIGGECIERTFFRVAVFVERVGIFCTVETARLVAQIAQHIFDDLSSCLQMSCIASCLPCV